MNIEQRVIVSQKPIGIDGEIVEYEGLDNHHGIVMEHGIHTPDRVGVLLDPTEEKPSGVIVNFRVEDLKTENPPTYTK